jgi:hypothetical protein
MNSRKILVPVLRSMSAADIARSSFWLAANQPADLHLIEVVPPPAFIRWLITPLVNLIRKYASSSLNDARQKAVLLEHLRCATGEVRAPNLVLGIVEAVWLVQSSTIIILPEMQTQLGRSGLRNLRNRLSEIQDVVLILPGRGLEMKIDPVRKKDPLYSTVVSIRSRQ